MDEFLRAVGGGVVFDGERAWGVTAVTPFSGAPELLRIPRGTHMDRGAPHCPTHGGRPAGESSCVWWDSNVSFH